MSKILLIHGPNLNLLGTREPDVYGGESLADVNRRLEGLAQDANVSLVCHQENSELALLQLIHGALETGVDFIIFNPAAYTHTSVVLRDALAAVQIPFVEVHISNVHSREDFRRHSYFSDLSVGTISGFGTLSYDLAFRAAVSHLEKLNP
ncbi:MAG: type II 3-dehydroquinate dehydratase [Pseudomonadota bacterium]